MCTFPFTLYQGRSGRALSFCLRNGEMSVAEWDPSCVAWMCLSNFPSKALSSRWCREKGSVRGKQRLLPHGQQRSSEAPEGGHLSPDHASLLPTRVQKPFGHSLSVSPCTEHGLTVAEQTTQFLFCFLETQATHSSLGAWRESERWEDAVRFQCSRWRRGQTPQPPAEGARPAVQRWWLGPSGGKDDIPA